MSIYRGRNRTEVYLASVLYDAIEDQDYSSVAVLLTVKKADPNLVLPVRGIAPFHLAIGNDLPDFALRVTSLIIQNGGDPNVRTDDGVTAVHIAASWGRTEILRLLLSCGGDPEITDDSYRNALHYSVQEGHLEIAEIIREFVNQQRASALADFQPKIPASGLTLDKIIINNGRLVGEYEMAKDTTVDEDLNNLPKTNSTEYVRNWCNSQLQIIPGESLLQLDESSDYIQTSTDNVSDSLPPDKSSQEFTKDFHVNCKPRGFAKEDVSYYRQSSHESGIATLPNSLTDDKNLSDYQGYVLLKTDSDVSTTDGGAISNAKANQNRTKKSNEDVSSDYYTCTEASEDANVLEQNVFEISSSLSSGRSSCSAGTNMQRTDDQHISCVSISEIYRYTDDQEGVVLFEKLLLPPSAISQNESLGTSISKYSKLSSLPKSFDYDTDTLRKELTQLGCSPGPITQTTKRVYLRKLYHLQRHPEIVSKQREPINCGKVYSNELEKTLRELNWADDLTAYNKYEDEIMREFSNNDMTRRWREGFNKTSFTYLLLDPRVTKNLPFRSELLPRNQIWEIFLSAIFYIGKGKRSRPYSHLYDAIACFNKGDSGSAKLKCILDIWRDKQGVICLHVFQNVIPVEAYTREAAMISALKIENVTNLKSGDFYGVAATWTKHQRNLLGVLLLYKAMNIFLNEGERQLTPHDIE